MATLAVAVTDHWTDGKRVHVTFTVTPTGNYTTGGDTLNLQANEIKSASLPVFVSLKGQGVNLYNFIPGTTQANGKLYGSTGGTQFTGGSAYPTDTVTGYAIFPKFI